MGSGDGKVLVLPSALTLMTLVGVLEQILASALIGLTSVSLTLLLLDFNTSAGLMTLITVARLDKRC